MATNVQLKRALLVESVVLILVLVVAELLLRRVAPEYGHELFDAEHTGGYPILLNADGIRGPLVPKERAPDEYRVLALGDSATFGVAAAAESVWPARLAEQQPRLTAINASFPGTGLKDLRFALQQKWGSYRPDAVVLALTSNHVALAWIQRNEAPSMPMNQQPAADTGPHRYLSKAKRAYKSLLLPAFLSQNVERLLYRGGLLDHRLSADAPFGAMLAHGYRQLDVPPDLADKAWAELEKEIVAIKADTEQLGAKLFVMMIPARFMLSEDPRDNEKAIPRERLRIVPTERTRRVCERNGITSIDALEALRGARASARTDGEEPALYVQGDYTHLNADGHAAVARAVARSLFGAPGPVAR
jgi:lysophospholipase L1-like esterase